MKEARNCDDFLIISSKLHGDDGYRTFSVRVKTPVVEAVERIAQKTGRSRNEVIGLMLEYGVERCVIF